jgi:hypothetical protein
MPESVLYRSENTTLSTPDWISNKEQLSHGAVVTYTVDPRKLKPSAAALDTKFASA